MPKEKQNINYYIEVIDLKNNTSLNISGLYLILLYYI